MHCEIISHHRAAIQSENNLQDRLVQIKSLKKEHEECISQLQQECEQNLTQQNDVCKCQVDEWKGKYQELQNTMERIAHEVS